MSISPNHFENSPLQLLRQQHATQLTFNSSYTLPTLLSLPTLTFICVYYDVNFPVILANTCKIITENINPTAKNNTTNGSTRNPCASSVNNCIIVAEEPPAPAALVDTGAALAAWDFLSATVFLFWAFLNPPGACDCVRIHRC